VQTIASTFTGPSQLVVCLEKEGLGQPLVGFSSPFLLRFSSIIVDI
jgi:hypothetical protein